MIPIIPCTFRGFGVELRKLREADLPVLLGIRNDPMIRSYMEDKREVSLITLAFWLKKINKYGRSFPFIAYINGSPIAYIDLRNCDFTTHSCEDGIFLFNKMNFGKGYGSRILLCREKILKALNLKDVFSYVHISNERSLRFFKKVGAKIFASNTEFYTLKQAFTDRIPALGEISKKLSIYDEFRKAFLSN